MPTVTIYGRPGSRAFRNIWMAKESGVEVEFERVDHETGENLAPDFVALSPNARVPVLKDGDLILSESFAINLYLGRKYSSPIMPDTLEDQARVLQWSMWGMWESEAHTVAYMEEMTKPEDTREQSRVDRALIGIAHALDVLERVLSGGDHLLGDAFTVADLNVACSLRPLMRVGYNLSSYPKTAAWLNAAYKRPAAKDAVGMQMADVAA